MDNVTGDDGAGCTLSIHPHHDATVAKKKEGAKENSSPAPTEEGEEMGAGGLSRKQTKRFVYSLGLLDLRTSLYVAHGTSFRGEGASFYRALSWLQGVEVRSVRLDCDYSPPVGRREVPRSSVLLLSPQGCADPTPARDLGGVARVRRAATGLVGRVPTLGALRIGVPRGLENARVDDPSAKGGPDRDGR